MDAQASLLANFCGTLLMLAWLAACVYRFPGTTGQYRPEIPQPSDDRIMALAQLPPDQSLPPLPRQLRVEVSPRTVFEGSSAMARCYIPRSPENRSVQLAGATASMSRELGHSSDEFEFRLPIHRLLCGSYQVVCAVERADGTVRRQAVQLTVLGACNQDQGEG